MISTYLSEKIIADFDKKLTTNQLKLIEKLSVFVFQKNINHLFIIKGFAGTGKTSIVSSFIKKLNEFNINSVLLAPTGKSAKTFGQTAQHQSFTIHKFIYRQKSNINGLGKFIIDKNFCMNTIFWVDEASMISNRTDETSNFGTGQLLNDLIYYVNSSRNCKLVLIGDTAQLPPIGLNVSPALNANYLKTHFNFNITEVNLTKVVRQTLHSGIYFNATILRNHLKLDNPRFPTLKIEQFKDIQRISGNELIEQIAECYHNPGSKNTIVITPTNHRANIFNKGIRNSILDFYEQLELGDFLMIVKNNYYYLKDDEDFIANGEIAELVRIYDTQKIYGYEFADVLLQFPERNNREIKAKILLGVLSSNTPTLSYQQTQNLFNNILKDYPDITAKKKQLDFIRDNEYFNALQIKFAYAITCHKAQGGQWNTVFIDQGYLPDNKPNKDYIKWLYTALTRAVSKVFLINFNDKFFQ